MRPFGKGFVEFTRMNCSRCSCSSPVMKATTQMGKLSMWAARIAAMRCCPSTIHPGRSASARSECTGMTSEPTRVYLGPSVRAVEAGSKRTRRSNATTTAFGIIGSPVCK